MEETVSVVEAAEILDLNRETVRLLVKHGELKAHKKGLGRTSAFVIERESVLDFDRRRREQSQRPAR